VGAGTPNRSAVLSKRSRSTVARRRLPIDRSIVALKSVGRDRSGGTSLLSISAKYCCASMSRPASSAWPRSRGIRPRPRLRLSSRASLWHLAECRTPGTASTAWRLSWTGQGGRMSRLESSWPDIRLVIPAPDGSGRVLIVIIEDPKIPNGPGRYNRRPLGLRVVVSFKHAKR